MNIKQIVKEVRQIIPNLFKLRSNQKKSKETNKEKSNTDMALPKFPQKSVTERIGVHHVASILAEMGLIFRETSNSDTGIDGYIEEVNENQEATGRLLAIQIKSGATYLHDQGDNYVYYADESHIHYWKLYPIPVILCAYNPDDGNTYFQTIKSYVVELSTKIIIPKTQILSIDKRELLFESIAGFSTSYHNTEELYELMNNTRIATPNNNYVSFLDLFVGGMTNLCTDLFCDFSVLSNLVDLRSMEPTFFTGQEHHEFLWEFIKFITRENLAVVNFDACLFDWEERMMTPRILVPLTYRGIELRDFIDKKHPDTVFEAYVSIQTDHYWDEKMNKLKMDKA